MTSVMTLAIHDTPLPSKWKLSSVPPSWLPELCLLAITILSFSCSALAADRTAASRIALVIGNSAYESSTPLANPVNDARAVAEALTRIGFKVEKGIDLNRYAMEDKLYDFGNAAENAEIACAAVNLRKHKLRSSCASA